MGSSDASRTRAGQAQEAGCVLLGVQTGRVRIRHGPARQVGLESIEPGTKLAANGAPGCPEGAAAVPQGGKGGGIQRSALGASWGGEDERLANSGAGVWNAGGTVRRAPTAHRSRCLSLRERPLRVLLLLPDCWTARPGRSVVP